MCNKFKYLQSVTSVTNLYVTPKIPFENVTLMGLIGIIYPLASIYTQGKGKTKRNKRNKMPAEGIMAKTVTKLDDYTSSVTSVTKRNKRNKSNLDSSVTT